MRPEDVSQERGEDGGYLISPAPRIIGAHAATPHPRGGRKTRKRRPRTQEVHRP